MTTHPDGPTTQAERDRALQLRAEGASIRQIAATVFGDQRYRGKVERILKNPNPPPRVDAALTERDEAEEDGGWDEDEEIEDLEDLTATELLRLLYERRLRRAARAKNPPTPHELRTLQTIQRELEQTEKRERDQARLRAAEFDDYLRNYEP
jgi:hypothetical protein